MFGESVGDGGASERILLLGRQGSGKGLIGRLLAARIEARFLSMGDLLRAEQRRGTDVGVEIGQLIDAGDGVPPDLSYDLMSAALTARAAGALVIDGIPRRADETDRVRALLGGDPTAVLVLDVPTPIAVERLRTRRSCSACGMPHGPGWPASDGDCRDCGAAVEVRLDDVDRARIDRRFEVWGLESQAIVRHYGRMGLVREVMADAPVLDVLQRAATALGSTRRSDV